MDTFRKDVTVKKMAELLRTGATLTNYTCPACTTPLLKLKTSDHYCVNCEKSVVIVKSDEEEIEVSMRYNLAHVRDTIFNKILGLNKSLKQTQEVDGIQEITRSLLLLLEAYDRVSKIINELGRSKQA